MKLSRRTFIAGLFGGATATFVTPVVASTPIAGMDNILDAFPVMKMEDSTSKLNFFMRHLVREGDDEESILGGGFQIDKVSTDDAVDRETITSYLKEKIPYIDDVGEIKSINDVYMSILRCKNNIVKACRRRMGNYYFYNEEDEEMVIFYAGNTVIDSPILANDKTGYNVNSFEGGYEKYFCRFKLKKELYEEWLNSEGALEKANLRPHSHLFPVIEKYANEQRQNLIEHGHVGSPSVKSNIPPLSDSYKSVINTGA